MSQPYRGRPGAGGGGGMPGKSILGVLQATQINETKPVLPAEILAQILDHLPVADQMRFARANKRLREMVYEDARWVSRLQSMGLWNEKDARRHYEEVMAKRRQAAAAAAAAAASAGTGGNGLVGGGGHAAGRARPGSGATTLFDASLEEERRRQFRLQQEQLQLQHQHQQHEQQMRDGFETLAIAGSGTAGAAGAAATSAARNPLEDPEALLNVLKSVKSVRGHAREEYGKVYGALAPFYWDLQNAKTHADPVVFKVFHDPERQARMLSSLRVFAQSDWSEGWHKREEKIATMTNIFESAVLREFEQGYEFWDVDGRMRKYAHVLDVLDNSTAGIDLFIQKHPIFDDAELTSMNSMDCIRQARVADASLSSSSSTAPAPEDLITLDPSRVFFEALTRKLNEQSLVIARIFPHPGRVFWALVDKVREDMIMEYITPILDETHERNLPAYLTAVSGLFEQCLQFLKALTPPKPPGAVDDQQPTAPKTMQEEAAEKTAAMIKRRRSTKSSMTLKLPPDGSHGEGGGGEGGEDGENDGDAANDVDAWRPKARLHKVKELAFRTFEPHLDLYLQEELDYFTKHAEAEVRDWDQKLSEQDANAESFYMSNFNRQEVKKDFLSSFKKVVMMPVTVLPSLPGLGSSSSSSSASTAVAKTHSVSASVSASASGSTPRPGSIIGKLPEKAPDDELAAKAALMASRLEGIKSLFSLEMALNLVHAAKISLGRAAVFVQLGGQAAGEAREQCESIFVVLLKILGNGHVKQGFDRAVEHLSQYNPRTVTKKPKKADTSGDTGAEGSSAGAGAEKKDDAAAGLAAAATVDGLGDGGVAPLMTFIELVNVGDLISQMIDVFYEQQLAGPKIADRNDFLDPAGLAKKRFEQMIDESVAAGLNKGIDVLMDEVEYICATTQKPTDYYPEAADAVAESTLSFLNGTLSSVTGGAGPSSGAGTSTPGGVYGGGSGIGIGGGGGGGGSSSGTMSPGSIGGGSGAFGAAGQQQQPGSASGGLDPFAATDIGPTPTAERVVALVRGHTNMLKGSTEKTMLDVFNGEVGLRLFTAVCKHLKRQRISIAGAVRVIADMTLYFDFIRTLRNPDLLAYFRALRELSQLYLIDARHHAKEMAVIIADNDRFGGVFRAEEVYEFAERRADWYQVKRNVERAMYGLECSVM